MNLRTSAMARLMVMAMLMVGLLVPLTMVQAVVSERATRRASVVEEISGTWGSVQTVGGPVLTIPYRYMATDSEGRPQPRVTRAHFLPDALEIAGEMSPSLRARGLFKVVVYTARLRIAGRFARPDFTDLRPAATEPLWDEATISIAVADPRGIAKRVVLKWNGADMPLVPGVEDTGLFTSGLHASAGGLAAAPERGSLPFAFEMDLNGSRDLKFLPTGSETSVRLTSSWPHPSFAGAPLPASYEASARGFTASWSVPFFGRGYPPRWTSVSIDRAQVKAQADASAFGVSLLQPVDVYQQAERAVKYASLFIVLTFVIFFLWETVRARLLHPVQYLFVGFAMCVFYLLLLSISEHVGFDVAYTAAATATTSLIAGYSIYVLGGLGEGLLMGLALSVLYGFLYMLLRLEDYALLAGSIGLFTMLALLMYCTRRVNWYELRLGGSTEDGVKP